MALHERVLAERTVNSSLERIVSSRRTTFDLYTHVNEQIQKHAPDESVKLTSRGGATSGRAMQAVNVSFQNTHVRTLITVIHEIYSGRNLIVLERLHHMRPGKAGYGIDCEMTLIAPQ